MTDISIRAAMALTMLVAIANAALFYNWVSFMWWLFGALPFGVLTLAGFWAGHVLEDRHRGGLACTLLLAALAWPLALTLAPAFVGLALVVITSPTGRFRAAMVVPATLAMLAIAVLSAPWASSSATAGWTYGLSIGHAVALAIPSLLFARERVVSPA